MGKKGKKGRGGGGGGGGDDRPKPSSSEPSVPTQAGPSQSQPQPGPPFAGGRGAPMGMHGPPPGMARGPPPGMASGPPPGMASGPPPGPRQPWGVPQPAGDAPSAWQRPQFSSQQQPRGPPPHQQQQPRGAPPYQQQQPRGTPPYQQQQPRGPSPRGPPPQQQQQQPRGPPPQQQQPRGPPPQQQQPRGPPPQQQQPRGPPPQQQQPRGPPPQQQQPRGPPPQQQQQQQRGPPPQQTRGPSPPQQEQPQARRVEQVGEGMKKMSLGFQIPKRKPPTSQEKKVGKPIVVETNHLALSLKNPRMVVVHYDVTVEPEKPFRFYRPALQAVQKKCYPNRYPAFDGRKNLYSYPELPFTTRELRETVQIYDNEKQANKEVTVTIKYANSVDLSTIEHYMKTGSSCNTPQDAIQALDVVLRQPAANRFVTVGRSFFTPPPGRVISLGDGMDLWYGFFQSAIIGWKPFLNIDVAHKGFPSPSTCLDILCNIVGQSPENIARLNNYQERSFLDHVKGLKVVCEIPQNNIRRVYKVLGLSECPAKNTFNVEDRENNTSRETTVERYYFQTYRFRLRYPNIPCLKVGSLTRPVSIPLELCRIQPGQVTMKKLNELQTRNMIKEAAVDTDRRKDKIYRSMGEVGFNNDPHLREFGLSVAEQFTKVPARILRAPTVDYKDKSNKEVVPVRVNKGVWKIENTKFLSGADAGKWCVLNANKYIRPNDMKNLADGLTRHGQEIGLNISPVQELVTYDTIQKIQEYFKKSEKEGVKLLVIILPDRGVTYAQIKKMAELQVGILTQCVKSITVQKRLNASTFINILLKINAKLNGVNHNITRDLWPKLFMKPVMVVGADVTHPAPGSINVPSIAAVAASHDPKAFKYNMIWKLQPPRVEVISDLKNIIKDHLMFFYKANKGLKPLKILFYRDGVSEGQFSQILDVELRSIREACSSLDKEYQPQVTFLVVQKRHHTRFFPAPQDADGRNKNVPAGTIVDTTITHPTELDFYLVSHASIQGTARPTKYHLLWDDSDLSEQELGEITYYLCHLFARCTRSVSYPAPTYYAHLAAFRARSYTEPDGNQPLNLDDLDNEQKRREIKHVIKTNNPMFFV